MENKNLSNVDTQITKWFDTIYTNFKNIKNIDSLFENDTQFDIDSAIIDFNKFYLELTGKEAPAGLFSSEIRKRHNKKHKFRYSYDCSGDDYDEIYDHDDNNQYRHYYDQRENQPDDHYQ